MRTPRVPDDQIAPPPPLAPGFYRHFKGGLYQVIAVAAHASDPHAFSVVYWSLALRRYWLREYAEFTGTVERDGRVLPRFAYLGANAPAGTDAASLAGGDDRAHT